MGQIVTTDYRAQNSRERRTRKLRFYRGKESRLWFEDPCAHFHEGRNEARPKQNLSITEDRTANAVVRAGARALITRLRKECSSDQEDENNATVDITDLNKNCLQTSEIHCLSGSVVAFPEPIWFHKHLSNEGEVVPLETLLQSALVFDDQDEADEYLVLAKSKIRLRVSNTGGRENEFMVTEQVQTKVDGRSLWRTTLTCDDVKFSWIRNSHVKLKGVFRTVNTKGKWVKPMFALMFRNEILVGSGSNLKGSYIREMTSNLQPLTWVMTFKDKKVEEKVKH